MFLKITIILLMLSSNTQLQVRLLTAMGKKINAHFNHSLLSFWLLIQSQN